MTLATIEHPALAKYREMKSTFNTTVLVQFAVRDGYAKDETSARSNLDGVLQWLACHAVKEHAEQPYVMMNGVVDEMYHAFMLNTRLYLHFCRDYIGFFIHHTPVDDVQADEIRLVGGIDYTVDFLQEAFGDELAQALQQWVIMREQGELSASSVSCVANDTDHAPDQLLGITDFRSFWDRNPDLSGRA
jgi:hypothetical protein